LQQRRVGVWSEEVRVLLVESEGALELVVAADVDEGARVHQRAVVQHHHAELEPRLRERVARRLVERHHLHDSVGPLGGGLVALRGALPVALVGDLDAHHQREAEHHAEHVERVRVVPCAARLVV
jgi:hypothetical protein